MNGRIWDSWGPIACPPKKIRHNRFWVPKTDRGHIAYGLQNLYNQAGVRETQRGHIANNVKSSHTPIWCLWIIRGTEHTSLKSRHNQLFAPKTPRGHKVTCLECTWSALEPGGKWRKCLPLQMQKKPQAPHLTPGWRTTKGKWTNDCKHGVVQHD